MITEVGWATFPEPIATQTHAQQFLQSLANSLDRTDLAYSGIDVYAFEFFDESLKSGASDEPHFGWYSEEGCKKYDILEITPTNDPPVAPKCWYKQTAGN